MLGTNQLNGRNTERLGSFIDYVDKTFRIRTQTCAYQGVRDVIFSENFANVINE